MASSRARRASICRSTLAVSRHAQRCGGLVEQDDLPRPVSGAGDGDALPLAAGQHADGGPDRRHVHVELVEQPPRFADHPHPVQPPDRSRGLLAAQEHVHVDRLAAGQGQVLVHDLHAVRAGAARVPEGGRLAVQQHRAGVGGMHAADDLDHRRLAGAVVAHQRHDPARMQVEREVLQRHHAAEGLADVPQVEDRGRRGSRAHAGHGSGRPKPFSSVSTTGSPLRTPVTPAT